MRQNMTRQTEQKNKNIEKELARLIEKTFDMEREIGKLIMRN